MRFVLMEGSSDQGCTLCFVQKLCSNTDEGSCGTNEIHLDFITLVLTR